MAAVHVAHVGLMHAAEREKTRELSEIKAAVQQGLKEIEVKEQLLVEQIAAVKIQTRFRGIRGSKAMKQVHLLHAGLVKAARLSAKKQVEHGEATAEKQAETLRRATSPPCIFITLKHSRAETKLSIPSTRFLG